MVHCVCRHFCQPEIMLAEGNLCSSASLYVTVLSLHWMQLCPVLHPLHHHHHQCHGLFKAPQRETSERGYDLWDLTQKHWFYRCGQRQRSLKYSNKKICILLRSRCLQWSIHLGKRLEAVHGTQLSSFTFSWNHCALLVLKCKTVLPKPRDKRLKFQLENVYSCLCFAVLFCLT